VSCCQGTSRGHRSAAPEPRLHVPLQQEKYDCRDRHADERPYEWLTFSEHSKDFENVLFQDIGNPCLKTSKPVCREIGNPAGP
jgi:hypothetical protein